MTSRLPPELVAVIQESYARAKASAVPPRPSLRGDVVGGGNVLVEVIGDDGRTARASLDPPAAEVWAGTITVLAARARRLRRERLWLAWPDPDAEDVYLVGQAGVEPRRFYPVRIRRPRPCTACGFVVVAGALMWREEITQPYATPNWREVRLCKPCITAPLPGEERGPG